MPRFLRAIEFAICPRAGPMCTDGSFSAQDAEETVFHHTYNFRTDELGINLDFNLHDKVRGVHKGKNLDEMDNLNTWPYTKQHIARLLGQCYQLSGNFLDPLLVSFKIFFSECCKLGLDWKQKIDDIIVIKKLFSSKNKTRTQFETPSKEIWQS